MLQLISNKAVLQVVSRISNQDFLTHNLHLSWVRHDLHGMAL